MSEPDTNTPVPGITEQLEQQLEAARKEKTLVQVPALRRLRNVVRVYVVIGLLAQLAVPLTGYFLWQTYTSVGSALGRTAFFVYAVTIWLWTPVTWLMLTAYARFLKQFRANQVHDIKDTTGMILRLWNFSLSFNVLVVVLQIIMFMDNIEMLLASGVSVLGTLIGVALMFFVLRRYVKTAQAELPLLTAAAGEGVPRGKYRDWKQLFLIYLGIAFVAIGLGFGIPEIHAIVKSRNSLSATENTPSTENTSSHVGERNVSTDDEILRQTSQKLNATLPMQIDSGTRLDTTTSGPGQRLSYFYTLLKYASTDLDAEKFSQAMRPQILNAYRTNPEMADLRKMQVELRYVYRDKDGNAVTTISVSPADF